MGLLENHAGARRVENYIPTVSPYSLPKPADWFLDELFAFDPELRIFPSLDQPLYRIMRVMHTSQPWTVFMEKKPDTQIAIRFNLYPVTSVNPSTLLGFSWGRVLLDLQERDQWQFKNSRAVASHIEGAEDRAEASVIAGQIDEADMRSIDMYRAYQGMNGSRTSLAHRTPDGAVGKVLKGPPRRAYRPQNAGAGAFFTGRTGAAASPGRP